MLSIQDRLARRNAIVLGFAQAMGGALTSITIALGGLGVVFRGTRTTVAAAEEPNDDTAEDSIETAEEPAEPEDSAEDGAEDSIETAEDTSEDTSDNSA